MKQLTDNDLNEMIAGEFIPDDKAVRKTVKIKPTPPTSSASRPGGEYPKVDLHGNTEQISWERIAALINSGARRAVVITGASGILKTKFQQWMKDSILSPKIISVKPLNNGSFEIMIRRKS